MSRCVRDVKMTSHISGEHSRREMDLGCAPAVCRRCMCVCMVNKTTMAAALLGCFGRTDAYKEFNNES